MIVSYSNRPHAQAQEALLTHYARLEPASVSSRFLAPITLKGLTKIVNRQTPGHVVEMRINGEIRGVCEIEPIEQDSVEIAISIEDKYQGQGYGKDLLKHALRHARESGAQRAVFYFSSKNTGILKLLKSLKATTRRDGSDMWGWVDLKSETKSQP